MAGKSKGRPSKLDKQIYLEANISFIIIIIILLILLTIGVISIVNPSFVDTIKANIFNLFN